MPHPVDTHVGQRIRQRRWLVGMTQQTLADKVGIKFQQIQKYETGANRVSASRLWEIANTLAVPIDYFFEGYASPEEQSATDAKTADVQADIPSDIMNSKEAASLVRAYFHLSDSQRKSLFELTKVLGNSS